jgi:adenylate cyclase
MPDTSRLPRVPSRSLSFDGALGRQIVELYTWVVREGIRGAAADALFDSLCQRFVIAGVPLWRAFAGMPTSAWCSSPDYSPSSPRPWWPTGSGSSHTASRASGIPFGHLSRQMEIPLKRRWLYLRRRLVGPEARLDFPILKGAALPALRLFRRGRQFGADGDPSHGTGIGYSFATDRPGGFSDDD